MRRMLLRQAALICAITSAGLAHAQSVAINVDGAAPNANAMLDVDAAGLSGVGPPNSNLKRGIMIPRMTGVQRSAIPVTAADDGLWVFQTDAPSGFYYYENGTGWVRWADGVGWALEGNSIVDPTTQWLGTAAAGAANKNFVVRSVSPATATGEMMISGATGFVSLGTTGGATPPTERLDVGGAIRVGAATGAFPDGTIQYGTIPGDDPNNWHYGHDGTRWRRMENAENLVTSTPTSGGAAPVYARDTMTCAGETGLVLTASQLLNTGSNALPPNGSTPFITAPDVPASPQARSMRTQYIYRGADLFARGLCSGTITTVGLYLMDGEPLTTSDPPVDQTRVTGTIRITSGTANLTYPAFSASQFMHEGARNSPYVAFFQNVILTAGWMDFDIVDMPYNAGDDIVVDICFNRTTFTGISPRVDCNLSSGYNSCRWVYGKTANTLPATPLAPNYLMNADDSPTINPANANTSIGMSQVLPTMRFHGGKTSPTVVARNANYINYDGGLMVGTATWANTAGNFKGPGTIRAQNGVYDGGVALSDHVFDRYFDGTVKPEEREAAADYRMVPLDELRTTLEQDRHLPDLPSREEWEATGTQSLGRVQTGLWRTVETQALYIAQLEKDLSVLEANAFGNDLTPQRVEELIQEVRMSKRLTDVQKLHLVAALRQHLAQPTSK